ncbi:hypothetical protein [Oryzomonas rubra]|uniref:Uncharacterized protein n=1 Tax=Oryzomonas rubra TaxID=2509454 RepID=A0A5A9XBR9_9BACT|nr:hypothetical protein [Oryzomonas rubra]KAA0890360.1 hypothetical protein ET418_11880 [Oryzomonas rubra]
MKKQPNPVRIVKKTAVTAPPATPSQQERPQFPFVGIGASADRRFRGVAGYGDDCFQRGGATSGEKTPGRSRTATADSSRVVELEQELQQLREALQTTRAENARLAGLLAAGG